MVAQALCAAPRDNDAFARNLACRLRWWLLGLPAGIGFATLRSILKLWLGFSPARSGVFSAGNGPAMRSAVLGAAIDEIETLQAFVLASTRITHTDPKAFHGALAVALAAWCAKRRLDSADAYFGCYRAEMKGVTSEEFDELMSRVEQSAASGESTETFAEKLGCGQRVSGYVYRTVPIALHAWLRHPRDLSLAVQSVIRCGGDTDTTAAIVGGIVGAGVRVDGIPPEWLHRLWEWPRSVKWMRRLAQSTADAVHSTNPVSPPRVFPFVGFVRNVLFLLLVLLHAFRRLLPPY